MLIFSVPITSVASIYAHVSNTSIKIENVTIRPAGFLPPPHPAPGTAAILSSVTIKEFCLILNIRHSFSALVCWLRWFSLRCTGSQLALFLTHPLRPLILLLGGFKVCSLRIKQQGQSCQGVWRTVDASLWGCWPWGVCLFLMVIFIV